MLPFSLAATLRPCSRYKKRRRFSLKAHFVVYTTESESQPGVILWPEQGFLRVLWPRQGAQAQPCLTNILVCLCHSVGPDTPNSPTKRTIKMMEDSMWEMAYKQRTHQLLRSLLVVTCGGLMYCRR